MRIYEKPFELMSEMARDVWEMGQEVHPHSMQNKIVAGDPNFITKEITNYSYCLTSMADIKPLFIGTENPINVKKWADAEFKERVSNEKMNPGEAWKIREKVWEEFLVDGKMDYTYPERISDQASRVSLELSKNPDSRQAIISIWERSDVDNIGGLKRVPCSMYYQILIRNGSVHLIYNQRSADLMKHLGNDIYLAWKMKEYIRESVNIIREEMGLRGFSQGFLFHNIGSLHSYRRDWRRLKEMHLELQGLSI